MVRQVREAGGWRSAGIELTTRLFTYFDDPVVDGRNDMTGPLVRRSAQPRWSPRGSAALAAAILSTTSAAQTARCSATPASLTPAGWVAPSVAGVTGARAELKLFRTRPLPGPANRFDYQSIDPAAARLYMNHMNAGTTLVYDLDRDSLVAEVKGVPRATGVLAVPAMHAVYVSAAGAHQLAVVDDRSLSITARVGGIDFPDGIAYASAEARVFVSDESGGADVVVDARTNMKVATIALGGEAGNTHYDSVSHCILVAVQTKNQLIAIDPASATIVQRYDLAGSDHPHGFTLDEPGRLAFISCEGNAMLLVVDLRTMRVLATHRVGDGPDVLAWDPGWRRLYVATEGGVLNTFVADGATLVPAGDVRAPHAHTVAVDPRTHRVYLPLQDVGGKPELRIYSP